MPVQIFLLLVALSIPHIPGAISRAIADEITVEDFRLSRNFHDVDHGKLFRSAQLTGKELQHVIATRNIKTIINLRGAAPGTPWFDEESSVAAEMGVQLINIGMSARRLPHKNDLIKLLDAFASSPRPILIHCQAGADRTGEAAAIYAQEYMGWSKKKSLKMASPRYLHFPIFMPSKHYFLKHVYQGEQWARSQYDPCEQSYKYYDQREFCSGIEFTAAPNEADDT